MIDLLAANCPASVISVRQLLSWRLSNHTVYGDLERQLFLQLLISNRPPKLVMFETLSLIGCFCRSDVFDVLHAAQTQDLWVIPNLWLYAWKPEQAIHDRGSWQVHSYCRLLDQKKVMGERPRLRTSSRLPREGCWPL